MFAQRQREAAVIAHKDGRSAFWAGADPCCPHPAAHSNCTVMWFSHLKVPRSNNNKSIMAKGSCALCRVGLRVW